MFSEVSNTIFKSTTAKNRFTFLFIAVVLLVSVKVLATKSYNKYSNLNQNTATNKAIKQDTIYYLAPAFLRQDAKGFIESYYNLDTEFKYEFYDDRDSITHNINSFDEVNYISLFKSYTDSQHTYRDKEGKTQYLPVSQIMVRYDRVDTNEWMSINYINNKYSKLKEYKDTVVFTDTVNQVYTEGIGISIFKYYKVVGEK